MTTKAPSGITPADPSSLQALAYASVEGIPTRDAHDADRLGYCVYLWLTTHRDTLEQAIRGANARLSITDDEAARIIRERLQQRGVTL